MDGSGASFTDGISKSTVAEWELQVRDRQCLSFPVIIYTFTDAMNNLVQGQCYRARIFHDCVDPTH